MKKLLPLTLLAGLLGLTVGCEQHDYKDTKMFNQEISLGHGHGEHKEHKTPAAPAEAPKHP